MGKDARQRYLFPDPPAPYELQCFKVYVPKHNWYIGAFWQAYQFFTSWLAWANDPLKRGRQAAALWREAYDKARALYEITKGQCEMNVTGVRFHPNDKCLLQVQYDGGDWVNVGNISDCAGCSGGSGATRFDGVNVSIYNSCTDEFEPSGTPYNPTSDHIYDSLYEPSTQSQCNAAANIAAWSKYASDNSLSIFATAGVAGAAASFILGTLANQAGAMFLTESLIASLLSQFVAEGELFDDASSLDISAELRDIIAPYISQDGALREPEFTAAITALYARRDEEDIDTPARVRWGHETNIMSALGPSVVSRQNKYAGITDADCSGTGWVQVFDFEASKNGWVMAHVNGGIWASGAGWQDDLYTDPDGGKWRGTAIQTAMLSSVLTDVKVYYNASLGINTASDDNEYRYVQFMRNGFGVSFVEEQELTVEGEQLFHWSGSEGGTTLVAVALNLGHDSVDPKTDPGGDGAITKIILSGTGINPFA